MPLFAYYLLILGKYFVKCQEEKKRVVFCTEKFTERKTNRDYTNYTGCLIEKSKFVTFFGQ